MNAAVVGAGAWGTALAGILHQGGHRVTLWGHDAAHLEDMRRERRNERYLPGVELPSEWHYASELANAVQDRDFVVMAVPSKVLREVAARMSGYRGIVISVTKGIEYDTGMTMSRVLTASVPGARVAAMSGPSLAMEVARGVPTAIVAAGPDDEVCGMVQEWFHRPRFRVYTSRDVVGVEMGGALKNVVAIAAGVGDGLGFGANSKASLLTRGIVEIRRLGVACGAQPETFSGLSGLGDLTVTCFSPLSRNRTFGERIGQGEPVEKLIAESVSIVEGYPTSRAALRLSRKLGLETPIIDEICSVLYEGKPPGQAVEALMQRESKSE